MLELLIENGADVNFKNSYGLTVLTYLSRNISSNNDLEILKLLIRKGCNINITNNKGDVPLIIYLAYNSPNIRYDITKLFLDNKADIYIKNKNGKTIFNFIENNIGMNSDIYSLILNYKNLKNDNFCECDINFIYRKF